MILEILPKVKPFAPLARAFSVSVASISSLRIASISGESPESVSSKNVGDFGTALSSSLAFFRISSASSTKVGASWLISAIIGESISFAMDCQLYSESVEEGTCQGFLSRALYKRECRVIFREY
jgi:hypothetical protein